MKKSYKSKFAFLFIFLMVTLPVYVSVSIAQTDGALNAARTTSGERKNIPLNVDDSSTVTSRQGETINILAWSSQTFDPNSIPDPGDAAKQCIAKHEQSSALADFMDNDVIRIVEQVAATMYFIYTTMTAIHTTLSAISQFFSLEGGCCAGTPYTSAFCGSFDGIKNTWDSIYNSPMVAALGCFISCGWCTGQGNCGGFFAQIPLFNQVPKVMGNARLSPYENIYTATACLCPTAILFNLRKLKTIYDTYDCCIEQACTNGISTQGCERMLDEATCMYWKGSLYKMLVRIVIGMLAGIIQKMILNIVGKNAMLNCLLAIFDLAQIPNTFEGVKQGYSWMMVTFSKPECKDLGFDKIIKEVQADRPIYKDVKVYDSNRDGRYDGLTEVAAGKDGEVHGTKTNYQETAITNNRAVLNERGKIETVDPLPESGGVDIQEGDIITIQSTGKSYVVEETDVSTASKFGYTVQTSNGEEIVFNPSGAEGTVNYDDVKVERLSEDATYQDKKLYNGLTTATHKYNKYESKEKVYTNDAQISADIKKGESAVVQKDGKYYLYSKDSEGKVTQSEVAVIENYKTYSSTVNYKANIDGKQVQINEVIVTDKGEYTRVNGQLYKWEGDDKAGGWKKTDDPEPIVVQGKTDDATIVKIKEQEKSQKRDERAYKAAWLLLDMTLGKYAYKQIDEMCKQEWESSED